MSTFVGRIAETRQLEQALSQARLVTLTGMGGIGKTRLALHVARRLVQRADADAGRAPVVLVDLRALGEAGGMPDEIAAAVGLTNAGVGDPLEHLVQSLVGSEMLLILDNCEHLVAEDVAEIVEILLEDLPQLRVLATSRSPLGVAGEHHWRLEPLSGDDAAALFADRARQVDPRFDLAVHREAVAELCASAGMVPMAVEIVAAQLRDASIAEVLADKQEALRRGRGARRRVRGSGRSNPRASFEETTEDSWRRATAPQRVALQRMAVFADGAGADDAAEVLADEQLPAEDVRWRLQELTAASMVNVARATRSGGSRYWLSEPIKAFALRKARLAGEELLLQQRRLAWVQSMVETAAREWCGPDELGYLHRVRAELPNIRAALDWCWNTGRSEDGIRVVLAVFRLRVPFVTGELALWRGQLGRFLPSLPPGQLQASAVAASAYIGLLQGDDEAVDLLHAAEQEFPGMACLVATRGVWEAFTTGDAACTATAAAARAAFVELGPDWDGDAAMADLFGAFGGAFHAPLAEADEVSARFLTHAEEIGAQYHLSWARWTRATFLWRAGRIAEAEQLLQDSLAVQEHIEDRWGAVWSVVLASWLAAARQERGEDERAAELIGAVRQLMTLTQVHLQETSVLGAVARRVAEQVRARMSPAAYAAAVGRGRELEDFGAVLALARRQVSLRPQEPDAALGPALGALTAREREVAVLIGAHSNAEIAEELHLSPGTVKTHVSSILRKLGLARRTQVPGALGVALPGTGRARMD